MNETELKALGAFINANPAKLGFEPDPTPTKAAVLEVLALLQADKASEPFPTETAEEAKASAMIAATTLAKEAFSESEVERANKQAQTGGTLSVTAGVIALGTALWLIAQTHVKIEIADGKRTVIITKEDGNLPALLTLLIGLSNLL